MTTPSACGGPDGAAVDDLIAGLPWILEHEPHNSAVLLMINEQQSVTLTARIDWNRVAGDTQSAATQAAAVARANGAVAVGILAVTPDVDAVPANGIRDVESALASLRMNLISEGVKAPWSATVTESTWASDQCGLFSCEPHDRPDPSTFSQSAEYVFRGIAPAESRDALAESVAVDASHTIPDSSWLLPASHEPKSVVEAWRTNTIDATEKLLRSGEEPTDSQAREIAAAMRDTPTRDTVIHRLATDQGAPEQWNRAWNVLSSTLRRVTGGDAAGVGAAAAVAGWQANSGLRANLALDRAFAADPEHRLAKLVHTAIGAGLPPKEWADAMAGLTEAEARGFDVNAETPTSTDVTHISTDPITGNPLGDVASQGTLPSSDQLGTDPLSGPLAHDPLTGPPPPSGPEAPKGPQL